ncbi:Zn-dependent M28 family amino/carboxypeptidase [Pontibacter ummariensis]|uniref:Zn-dependent amino- or carboxypeptidase, M28 family n=1 Tax=Pontibacter ummariensis TaxID=1610492 RepID=A0A239HTY0_9BACT|nr:M28 family peptidase [Pontibacter ummariensis]PRY10434.1 Zn-dependent M28 family amino/carboxypeptidase [Pontibacter ummariensis]SNS84721.1 Zn-dependent amino- or carboxypeptidase, M28 family [Pontibacter ummariensis]
MNRFPTLLLLFTLLVPALQAQDMQRVRHTIDTLTSPAMHGRGYVFDGDKKAANYLRDRFRTLGLQPLGNSYFQPFSFPVNRIVETPQLQVNGKKLIAGTDFVANAASSSGGGKASVLPLDTLVFTDAAVARGFFSQNFKDKALVIRQQDQQKLGQLPAPYAQKLQQAKVNVVLQPKALLTSVARQQAEVPVLEVLESAWPQDARKLSFEVKASLNPNHQTQNVIAFIRGSEQPDSVIVFSAHYDHLGGQGKDVYFPGANDNASGTSMLLELASYYSQPQHKPTYSMAFIAFAAEEAGLLGSFYYTQHPLFPLEQIRFLLNLDLLGTGSEGLMVVNGKVHEQAFEQLRQLNQQQQYLPQIKSRGKAANSDHYPFSEKGVPAFFFYTLGGTAAYHNTKDDASQLPLTKYPEVFKLLTDFVETLQ